MIASTSLALMSCMAKRLRKRTPYSSAVCFRCVVTRQSATSGEDLGRRCVESVEAEDCVGVADIKREEHATYRIPCLP